MDGFIEDKGRPDVIQDCEQVFEVTSSLYDTHSIPPFSRMIMNIKISWNQVVVHQLQFIVVIVVPRISLKQKAPVHIWGHNKLNLPPRLKTPY